MNVKLRSIVLATVGGVMFTATAPVWADATEDIINALIVKGVVTEEEGALILRSHTGEKQAKSKKIVTVNENKSTNVGDISLKLGGFIAAESAYRSRAEGADINSTFRNIPFPVHGNNVIAEGTNANQSELRGTARQSRISLLAQGKVSDNVNAEAYYENDFLAQPATGNLNQSDSFTLRIRNLYGAIDWKDEGLHLLAGQNWSLATLQGQGITQRKEKTPLSIDAQYVPGFTWARHMGVRLVKDWDKKYWAGLSLENPQTVGASGSNIGSNISTVSALGGGLLTGTSAISSNKYPDIIAKLATDNEYGHFEIYDLVRNFQSTYATSASANASNQSEWTNAVGGGVIIPLFENKLEFMASGLYGKGGGRYGTSQLPDVTFGSDGSLKPLTNTQFLTGLVWHTTPTLDLWAYFGEEKVDGETYSVAGKTYGYGNGVGSDALSTGGNGASAFNPQVSKITSGTFGFWWNAYKGSYGVVKFGTQYSYVGVDAFKTTSGASPHTQENMVFSSFRYYPFD